MPNLMDIPTLGFRVLESPTPDARSTQFCEPKIKLSSIEWCLHFRMRTLIYEYNILYGGSR